VKKILVLSDNEYLIKAFHSLISSFENVLVDYTCSPQNDSLLSNQNLPVRISALNVKESWTQLDYDLIFSLHCKQLFPSGLVKKIRCINVHPGFNPYNRGWFPQVFSILNGMKAGATIHEIDEELDHGAIIAQKEVEIEPWDTSLSAYNKIQQAEVELLKTTLGNIISNNYETRVLAQEGNINLKKDFNSLCKIDLDKKVAMQEAIDYLRAMSHGNYKNAYFIDKKTGGRVFVSIELKKDE
jgi:methionyl-tRNA formyltransferase